VQYYSGSFSLVASIRILDPRGSAKREWNGTVGGVRADDIDRPGTVGSVVAGQELRTVSAGGLRFKLAHFSDTHLGYQAYEQLSPTGENQRALDIVRAFVNVCKDIEAEDPPLIVHSGDVGDRSRLDIRYLLLIQQWLSRLTRLRSDGSRRQIVLISGNHDQPRQHKEACFLELFRGIPGVHVVTTKYSQIDFGQVEGASAELANLVVHALPHDQLKTVDFDLVKPVEGRQNILVAHGVAGGSELYRRSLGREYPIVTDVLVRDWDYVALGHWHKPGPVPIISGVGAGGKGEDGQIGRIWYAGSTESMGFRDLREESGGRGWLSVKIESNKMPEVERRILPTRLMLRLPVIEAEGMVPDRIAQLLVERLRGEAISGAVVSQVVTGVTREVWSLVDKTPAKSAASGSLHYAMAPKFTTTLIKEGESVPEERLGDLGQVLVERADQLLAKPDRKPALELAKRLLGIELAASVVGSGDDNDTAGVTGEVDSVTDEGSSTTPERMTVAVEVADVEVPVTTAVLELTSEADLPDNPARATGGNGAWEVGVR